MGFVLTLPAGHTSKMAKWWAAHTDVPDLELGYIEFD